MWSLWSSLQLHGRKADQFVDLWGYFKTPGLENSIAKTLWSFWMKIPTIRSAIHDLSALHRKLCSFLLFAQRTPRGPNGVLLFIIFTAGCVEKFKDYFELVILIWVPGVSGVTWATVFLSCRGTRVTLMIKRSQACNIYLINGQKWLLCGEFAHDRRALKSTIPWIND